MRDPYEVLGVPKGASRGGRSRAPSASSPRSCIPTPTRTIRRRRRKFAELNAAYEIVGDEDKRKAFDRGEIDAEGKPRFQGFEGAGGAAGRRGLRPRRRLRDLHLGPGRLRSARREAAAGGGAAASAASRTSSAACSAARRGGAAPARQTSRPRTSAPARRGRDVTGRCTITLAGGRARRHARACSCRPARRSRSRFRPASPTASRSG